MGEKTKIAWTGTWGLDGAVWRLYEGGTLNPWIGCIKVSEECAACYAENLMDTRYGKVKWGPIGGKLADGSVIERKRTSASNWAQVLRWNAAAKARGVRMKVFVASLADVFEDHDSLLPWLRDLLVLMGQCDWIDFLLLTKRIEHVNRRVEEASGEPAVTWFARHMNVWIGASMGLQSRVDERIGHLLDVPAAVRFVSVEPMLGPVSFRHIPYKSVTGRDITLNAHRQGLDWVIVGGESQQGKRPARAMHLDDVRDLIAECRGNDTPIYVKQMGTVLAKELGLTHSKGEDPEEWPDELKVRDFPDTYQRAAA